VKSELCIPGVSLWHDDWGKAYIPFQPFICHLDAFRAPLVENQDLRHFCKQKMVSIYKDYGLRGIVFLLAGLNL
jgi:hypothetical protein